MNSVFVHATTDLALKDLDVEDAEVPGVYQVELHEKTPAEGRANAALDGFHSSIPVGVLDDFQFTVRESADPASAEILSSDAFENDELQKYAISVDQVDSPFRVFAHFQPQAWVNDQAVDIDGAQHVDVTRDVLRLAKNDLDGLHALRDYRESADALVERHLSAIGHDGPFAVKVVEAVTLAFGVEKIEDITEAMVEEADARAEPEMKIGHRPR